EEEGATAALDPGGELVHFGVERVEQDDAAQPVAQASVVRAPGRRGIAAAVGDDDHRQALDRRAGGWSAVQPRQADCRLLDEAAKFACVVEAASARIGG